MSAAGAPHPDEDPLERERQRQQRLLQALWQPASGLELAGWLKSPEAALTRRGLQAYAANAGAGAERALAATYPTVKALVGDDAFAALARACWRALPPQRGDLAWFGADLPAFIEVDRQLADLPYLADVARLDALVARAEAAQDRSADLQSFSLLAEAEPAGLAFETAPGWAVLRSSHPVVTLWRAHHEPQAGFEAAREAIARGDAEPALVWRQGWKARVLALPGAEVAWCEALACGADIAAALAAAGEGFDFEAWLLQALQQSQVVGVRAL